MLPDTDPTTAESEPGVSAKEKDHFLLELPKQYELLGKISQGGMGAIYKARNRYTGVVVAIKVLKVESARKEKPLQRFTVEARAATLLKHPRICQVHDFGLTESNFPYLIMDWIDGIPMGKKVQREGRLAPQEAIYIFQQISSALEHAHANKVVHRDLKPDNIMLTRDVEGRTQVHIVDFGIAKVLSENTEANDRSSQITTAGTFVGTPLFMSPEQARTSADIDHRSDIYSLGCVMYYALAGEAPLIGISPIDTIAKHLHEAPPEFSARFKIPADLRAIVFRCMEKNVNERYQNTADLSADLKKLTKGVGIKHGPLVHEREANRKRLIRIVSFILGFGAMYAISVGLQAFFDSNNGTDEANSVVTPNHAKKSADSKNGSEIHSQHYK